MTTSGIEPGTFRFVAQHLNHCTTAVLLRHSCGNLKFRIFLSQICEMSLTLPEHTHRHKDVTIVFPFTTQAAEFKQWKQQKCSEFWTVPFVAPTESLIYEFQPVSKISQVLRYETLILKLSESRTVKFLRTKLPCTLRRPYTEGTWLYCEYFILYVSCTVVLMFIGPCIILIVE